MQHDVTYEPPWLERLREVDPRAAEVFDVDPKKATKLDMLLAGVANVETKLAIVRTALNAGVDPNDPAIEFAIMAVGIEKLVTADFKEIIESARASAAAGADIVEKIKVASGGAKAALETVVNATTGEVRTMIEEVILAIESNSRDAIARIDVTAEKAVTALTSQAQALATVASEATRAINALPEAAAQLTERVEAYAREAVTDQARKYASFTVAEQSQKSSTEILAGFQAAEVQAKEIVDALKPLRLAVERVKVAGEAVVLGIKMSARERRAAMLGTALGALIGFLLFGFLANVSYIGLSPDIVQNLKAGRFYIFTYSRISASCRSEFERLAAQRR
jgi:hypothetical protein